MRYFTKSGRPRQGAQENLSGRSDIKLKRNVGIEQAEKGWKVKPCVQRPCGEREHEKDKRQSEGLRDRKVKPDCKMKQKRKGGDWPYRILQAELRSQKSRSYLYSKNTEKSLEYFKGGDLIRFGKIALTSVWRLDWKRSRVDSGTPAKRQWVQMSDDSGLNLNAGSEDWRMDTEVGTSIAI